MRTKKWFLVVLMTGCILLAGLGLVGDVTPVIAAPTFQTVDEDRTEVEKTDDVQIEAGQVQVEEPETLLDVIQENAQLDDFETLIKAAGLNDNLKTDGPFTIFAPTDAAMSSLEMVAINSKTTVTEILLYHIINGKYYSSDIANHSTLQTLMGEQIAISMRGGEIILNDGTNNPAAISTTDVETENGIIHIVDAILMPPVNSLPTSDKGSRELSLKEVLAADGQFTTFLSLIENTDLELKLTSLSDRYTVFAPTDEAFEKLSEEQFNELLADPETLNTILSYHFVGDLLGINQIATDDYIPTLTGRPLIVSTDESLHVFLNGQPLIDFNIIAANGVIHPVDTVLMP